MTDQEVIELGYYCEELLRNEYFNTVSQQFEQQCFVHMMTTAPKDKMEREGIYSQYRGYKDFIAHLVAFVEQKNRLIKEHEHQPSTGADFEENLLGIDLDDADIVEGID